MLGMRRRWSGRVHPWPWAEGEGLPQYRQTVVLCSAGWPPGWLVWEYSRCSQLAGDGRQYFYGNCTEGLLEAKCQRVCGQTGVISPVIMCLYALRAVQFETSWTVCCVCAQESTSWPVFLLGKFLSATLEELAIIYNDTVVQPLPPDQFSSTETQLAWFGNTEKVKKMDRVKFVLTFYTVGMIPALFLPPLIWQQTCFKLCWMGTKKPRIEVCSLHNLFVQNVESRCDVMKNMVLFSKHPL